METICHVITKLELGGAQQVVLYVVSHLDRTRYHPVLVTGPGGLLTEEARRIPDLTVILLPALVREIRPLKDLIAWLQLIRLFRRLRPAIVHTHSSKAGILGRWAAWWARVPSIVHTIHGYGVTPAQPSWLRRLFIGLERVTGWVTNHWVAVAQADVMTGRAWGLFDRNVSVIRAGIDPRPFSRPLDPTARERLRREFGAEPGALLVGTVTCLKPQKAPGDFLAVAKRVCETLPQTRFVLVGDGELRADVESLARRYGLTGRICFAGWRRDVPDVMRALDAFLLTSHWEGLPRVVLEARTAGLPIVTTRVGGVEEVVLGQPDCVVREPGDIDGLSEGVLRVLTHVTAERTSAGRREKQLPREFSVTEMLERYERLYTGLTRYRSL